MNSCLGGKILSDRISEVLITVWAHLNTFRWQYRMNNCWVGKIFRVELDVTKVS